MLPPDRRVRFAAARALVELAPQKPFAGSSRVVPVLAGFVSAQSAPKVVIVDGNPNRAGVVVILNEGRGRPRNRRF